MHHNNPFLQAPMESHGKSLYKGCKQAQLRDTLYASVRYRLKTLAIWIMSAELVC